MNAVKEASAILASQLKTYDHACQFATTASRTSLDHPVNTLKQIFMNTQGFVVHVCMQKAKNELINYMGTVIRAFQAYGAGEADATIRDLVIQSDSSMKISMRNWKRSTSARHYASHN